MSNVHKCVSKLSLVIMTHFLQTIISKGQGTEDVSDGLLADRLTKYSHS